MFKEFK